MTTLNSHHQYAPDLIDEIRTKYPTLNVSAAWATNGDMVITMTPDLTSPQQTWVNDLVTSTQARMGPSPAASAHPDLTTHDNLGLATDASVSTAVSIHANTPHGTPVYAVLANGATAMAFGTNDVVKVTPTANATYTTTVPSAGREVVLLILTSGTTSRTITFGTGFKPTGTLATGTVTARVFAISFVSDGTNLYETARTIAMVA